MNATFRSFCAQFLRTSLTALVLETKTQVSRDLSEAPDKIWWMIKRPQTDNHGNMTTMEEVDSSDLVLIITYVGNKCHPFIYFLWPFLGQVLTTFCTTGSETQFRFPFYPSASLSEGLLSLPAFVRLSICLSVPQILVYTITQLSNKSTKLAGWLSYVIILDGVVNEPYWSKSSCSLRP